MPFDPIEFHPRRAPLFAKLLFFLFMTSFIVVLLFAGEISLKMRVMFWLGLPGLAFMIHATIREIICPRECLRIDSEGIHAAQVIKINDFDLPWSELANVRICPTHGSSFVLLDPVHPRWGLTDSSRTTQRLRLSNINRFGTWLLLHPQSYSITQETLCAEIERFRTSALSSQPSSLP